MTTTTIIISILFILCLTSPAALRSVGLMRENDKPSQRFLIPLLFGLSQGMAALLGSAIGRLIAHLFVYIADYMVFAMMLVVAAKLFIDSMRMLRGKMLYTVSTDGELLALSALAGFLWSFFAVRTEFNPAMVKKLSFIEFSAAVFMAVIAILYLFTDLI